MDRYLARLLPPTEWHRLGLPAAVLPTDPSNAIIVVVEDEHGEIIGRWFGYTTVTLEGLFINPEHRKHPGVAARLMQAMTTELVSRGVPQATTLIQTPDVAALAKRHGLYTLDGQVWVLDLRELLRPLLSSIPAQEGG